MIKYRKFTNISLITDAIDRHISKNIYLKCRYDTDTDISILQYVTLHKIVFRVPKITRTARTLYEIKGVIASRSSAMQLAVSNK